MTGRSGRSRVSVVVTVAGGLLLALAGCTSGGHDRADGGSDPTGSGRPSATATPAAPGTPTASETPSGTTHPVEAARLGPKDGALMDWLDGASLPAGNSPPERGQVVVARRGPAGTGEVAWMSGGTYCLGYRTQDRNSGFECGPYQAATDPNDPAFARMEWPQRMSSPQTPQPAGRTLVAILDDPGPFYFRGDQGHGVLSESHATLAPHHTVTFLDWIYEGIGNSIPIGAEVCSTATAACLSDQN